MRQVAFTVWTELDVRVALPHDFSIALTLMLVSFLQLLPHLNTEREAT